MNSKIRILSKFFSIALIYNIISPNLCLSMDTNTRCRLLLDNASCNWLNKNIKEASNINQKKFIENMVSGLLINPLMKYYLTEILQEVYEIISTKDFLDKYKLVPFNEVGYMVVNETLDICKSFIENYIEHLQMGTTKHLQMGTTKHLQMGTTKYFQFEHNYWSGNKNYFYLSYFSDWMNGENENLKKHCERINKVLLQIVKYIVQSINVFRTSSIGISYCDKTKMIISII